MIGVKKPSKKDRLAVKSKRESALVRYRKEQYALAWERDKGLCVFCGKPAQDTHHVYGRARCPGDWRENFKNLMCVCRKHHPAPIFHKPAGPKLAYVERKLEKING